jgi:single-strand DNA-binding protein
MLHREARELKGCFAWTCIRDGVTQPADVFGRLRPRSVIDDQLEAKRGTVDRTSKEKFMGLNRHEIIGNLGRTPELKVAPSSGRPWTRLWIATTETWKNKEGQKQEHTEWHAAVCWGSRAEVAAKYLQKGSRVYIAGPARSREYPDAQTGEIRRSRWIQAEQLVFLDGKRKEERLGEPPADEPTPAVDEDDAAGDDVPQDEAA